MKVTGIAICPPPGAAQNPKATHELTASCLAKYSRSNKGLDNIFAAVEGMDLDKAVDATFKFIDYGHASIGGLTGGIPLAVDGISMLLAYKLFEIAQLCDGQESSTRYIEMSPASLPNPEAVGIPAHLAPNWNAFTARAYEIYRNVYSRLDTEAQEHPEIVRLPAGAPEKVATRLRKNYALDRSRYYIPFATRTNAAYIMTARVWAQTLRQIASYPLKEFHHCAALLRQELAKFAPRLIRHSFPDKASVCQAEQEITAARNFILGQGLGTQNVPDRVFVAVDRQMPIFLPDMQSIPEAFEGKENRYSLTGEALRRIFVRFGFNNLSIAEMRDLNRHRSGFRFSPLYPVGFYCPPEAEHPEKEQLLQQQKELAAELAREDGGNGAFLYAYLLGTQCPWEHSTHADKFVYEVELRTGMGAHFRYAEHLQAAAREFFKLVPDAEPFVRIGTAEPE